MSIGDWFKRIFSAPARTDAPVDVATATRDEQTIDERRIDAGGGAPLPTTEFGDVEAGGAVEGTLSEYDPPPSD